jgi:hypothetical protein
MSFRRVLLALALLGLAACRSHSIFGPLELQGPVAMVDDAGTQRLLLLTKQEEQRQIAVGGSGRRGSINWRTDTFFHFVVEALDPATMKPAWKKSLVTFGDPDAKGLGPSRVIGSAVSAGLLGQDGEVVWLLVGDTPYGISVKDGHVLADAARLEQANAALKGMLPSEARHYGFDRGLVFLSADARQFVVRGPGFKAQEYTAPPPATEPAGQLRANGTRELVPMRPLGEDPLRQATLGGEWLGLYSPKEVEDIEGDEDGSTLRYPYSVHNEGALARRGFWRAKIATVRHFDDTYRRLDGLTPVAGAPTLLKGRFASDGRSGQPMQLSDPDGLLVWHSTRIDNAGRIALTRFDGALKPVWTTELPFSETSIVRRLQTWPLPGRLVVAGELETEDMGVRRREPYLASIDLANGAVATRNVAKSAR